MSNTISMDRSGRMVIPKDVRERLNLRGGARLRAAVVAGRLELTPVDSAESDLLVRRQGIEVLRRSGAKADARAAVAEQREAQASRGLRR